MKKKRISAFFLTIALLSGSLSSTAYAATWYMEDGDVIVSASESGQTVSQNNNTIGSDLYQSGFRCCFRQHHYDHNLR